MRDKDKEEGTKEEAVSVSLHNKETEGINRGGAYALREPVGVIKSRTLPV